MSWRVVVVSSRSKLELKLNYLVIRGEEVKRIHLDEISVLLIENTGCALTVSLLEALWKKKVAVIFCDKRYMPSAQLIPFAGSYDSSHKVIMQTHWTLEAKESVWAEIVGEKIRKQASCLYKANKAASTQLLSYASEILPGDASNREGFAAKVFFNAMFGPSFSRTEENFTNACLNYGYSILLAAVAREVAANGYILQLGIFHKGTFNQFNLACDLMEPFRPMIDHIVKDFPVESIDGMSKTEKALLLNVLNTDVYIDEVKLTLLNALPIYVRSVFDALESNDPYLIKFYNYEF